MKEKKQYICPMHEDIVQTGPGKCPKCGMQLVEEGSMSTHNTHHETPITWKSYMPLAIIFGLLFLVTITLSLRDVQLGIFVIKNAISYFMIGFFLIFAGFKLLDLKGFAEGYATYDLLAKRWYTYGYIYPFIELSFGLLMILIGDPAWLLLTEILVMGFSGIGVARKLLKKEKFQCACLGTFLKVPLTKITLVEDFGMVAGALALLLLR